MSIQVIYRLVIGNTRSVGRSIWSLWSYLFCFGQKDLKYKSVWTRLLNCTSHFVLSIRHIPTLCLYMLKFMLTIPSVDLVITSLIGVHLCLLSLHLTPGFLSPGLNSTPYLTTSWCRPSLSFPFFHRPLLESLPTTRDPKLTSPFTTSQKIGTVLDYTSKIS